MSLPGQPMVPLLGAPATAAAPAAATDSPPAGQHVRLLSWNVNGLRAALKRLNVTISQFLEGLGAGGCWSPIPWGAAFPCMLGHVPSRSSSASPPLPSPPLPPSADIICLQETKLRRCDIDRELAVVEGWSVAGARLLLTYCWLPAVGYLLPCGDGTGAGQLQRPSYPLNRGALPTLPGRDSFFCCDTTRATGYSGTATYVRSGVALPFAAEEGFTGCAPLAAGEHSARMGAQGWAPMNVRVHASWPVWDACTLGCRSASSAGPGGGLCSQSCLLAPAGWRHERRAT